jgi:hypothetical protein
MYLVLVTVAVGVITASLFCGLSGVLRQVLRRVLRRINNPPTTGIRELYTGVVPEESTPVKFQFE